MCDLDLKDLLPLATAVTALIGIWSLRSIAKDRMLFDQKLAREKFEFDKKLADRKRQQEIAEEILAGAYEFRDIIKHVRAPGNFASESAGRERDQNENDDVARTKDSYYVPISRVEKSHERIATILSKKYRAAALLGPDVEVHLASLRMQIIRVQGAAGALMRLANLPAERRSRESVEKYEQLIWSGAGDPDLPDPFDVETEAAVAKIEKICRPILSEGLTANEN